MSSSPCVFEVMIHRVQADAGAASILQHRLRQDGIRAGVADLAAAKLASATQAARYSLCLVGAAFGNQDLLDAPTDRFDFVFVAPDADAGIRHRKGCTAYGQLRNRLANGREGAPISAPALRRTTQASYDAVAAQFTEVWFDTVPREAIETFVTLLPRGASILDAGCGPGHHARFLKKVGFDPVGLDFSRSMLTIARKKNDHIPFIHGDILSHPLPKACFNGVWSAVALNHVPAEDVPRALANLVATLKCDGFMGLNFQVARPSEVVSRERDHRFFQYPTDEKGIVILLKALGVRVVATHFGATTRNIHGLTLEMRFATVVGRKVRFV
jgi:ubiquinone/menaquinone biosynthesis C-methylase UbiE